MNAFEAYSRFLAYHHHFNQDGYDGFRYNWKVRVNQDKFLQRNDRYLFHKLSKHRDPEGLMVSNMFTRDKCWVNDLFDDRAESIYNEMKRRQGTLSYNLKGELRFLGDDFNSALRVTDGQYPLLLKKYISKDVSPETLLAINELTGVFKEWDEKLTDTVFWPMLRSKLLKYRPFLSFKRDAIKKIILDNFSVL